MPRMGIFSFELANKKQSGRLFRGTRKAFELDCEQSETI